MLRIDVSGYAGEGKSEIIGIIREALKASGKRVLSIEDNTVAQPVVGPIDAVIVERYLAPSGLEAKKLDFLIGLTEAAAYELAQDHGYIVRIVKRNDIAMPVTRDFKPNRVNLSIVDNTVVTWTNG